MVSLYRQNHYSQLSMFIILLLGGDDTAQTSDDFVNLVKRFGLDGA